MTTPAGTLVSRVIVIGMIAGLLCHTAGAATPEEAEREMTARHASPVELFRNYALVSCLGQALPQVRAQTSAAAGGYVQFGEGPYVAYEEVTAAAQAFLTREYVSVIGADLSVMKCIDFTHSRSLDAIVRKYFPVSAHTRASKNGPR